MADESRQDVTLKTLHEDLGAVFPDRKTALLTGSRSVPTREPSQEMIRPLRETNRLQEERFAQPEARTRENHLQVQQTLLASGEGRAPSARTCAPSSPSCGR